MKFLKEAWDSMILDQIEMIITLKVIITGPEETIITSRFHRIDSEIRMKSNKDFFKKVTGIELLNGELTITSIKEGITITKAIIRIKDFSPVINLLQIISSTRIIDSKELNKILSSKTTEEVIIHLSIMDSSNNRTHFLSKIKTQISLFSAKTKANLTNHRAIASFRIKTQAKINKIPVFLTKIRHNRISGGSSQTRAFFQIIKAFFKTLLKIRAL